jgi:pimeloyl-ACP methyl ester carboxylesterase
MRQEKQFFQESVDAQHDQGRTPLRMAAAMGLTQYVFPSLSVRALGAVEKLMISSLCFIQIAFLVIRRPLLFEQNLLDASFRLSRLFLASPIAIATLAGLLVGYLATGVVLPGKKSPTRWNIPQTLVTTAIAVGGGLASVVLFILGVLLPIPWGYSLIAAGFFLGPWLPAQFDLRASRLAVPAHDVSSRWPNRREALRSLVPITVFSAVWTADIASILSVEDNRRFLKEDLTRAEKPEFSERPPHDDSIKVARLSSGLIRYRDMNPRGGNVVLGFPGWQESLYEFPLALETKLKELDIRAIVIERPGIGPVSTAWPGYDLADWAGLVEEFDKIVLDNRPISIVGHSAGGVYALACAKLACVRALALVSSGPPMTYGSFFATLFDYDASLQATMIGLDLFPYKLLPELQRSCQQMLYDWKSFKNDMLKTLGPIDGAMINQNDDAFRKNMVTSVLQGAAASMDDLRRIRSPWPLTLADTARLPTLIFRGAGDQLIPRAATQYLQRRFVPNATIIDFPDMGHQPALSHYEKVFAAVGKLHGQEEKKRLSSAVQ